MVLAVCFVLGAFVPLHSPHADALVLHPYDVNEMETRVDAAAPFGDARELTGTVFGYLPYWVSGSAVIHWERLSHLAYFAAALDADGAIASESLTRLKAPRYQQLAADAATHGVPLVLTITNFTSADIATLTASATRDKAIATIVGTAQTYRAQGINIDFEFVPARAKADFAAFIGALTAAMHAAIPGSHVSAAMPMDPASGYDVPMLSSALDGLMIMAYGCHYGGSTDAGPNSPLTSGATWSSCSVSKSIAEWLKTVPPQKLIIGLPLYGMSWPTSSSAVPSAATATGSSVSYASGAMRLAAGRLFDSASQTPYVIETSAGTHQLWLDDPESFDLKLALLQAKGAGLGLWALSYEGTETAFWDKITDRYTAPVQQPPPNLVPIADAGASQTHLVADAVTLVGSASHDPEGQPLTYVWSQQAGPTVTLVAHGALAEFTANEVGLYRFWLVVNDGVQDSAAAETEVSVTSAPVEGDSPPPAPATTPPATTHTKGGCAATSDAAWWAVVCIVLCTTRRRRVVSR